MAVGHKHTFECLHEEITVFRDLEGSDGCAKHLDAKALEDAHLVEGNTDVEGTLATESQKDTIWTFLFEYICDVIRGDWEEIDL